MPETAKARQCDAGWLMLAGRWDRCWERRQGCGGGDADRPTRRPALVKHFTPAELQPLMQMVRHLCLRHDPEAFRRSLENAGFLRPHAPLSTQTIIDHLAVFYDTIREPGARTITGDYASAVVRRFFDVRCPVAGYVSIPRSYVILQRINLGLFAVLGQLTATANWRAIAEEIWPLRPGPASTPMGEAEAAWRTRRPAITGSLA